MHTSNKDLQTKGYHSQPKFDSMISNLDVSSLKFLNHKYKVDIRHFREIFDLGDVDNQQQYQEMLQRKKMIQEELDTKIMNIYSSQSYQDRKDYFDIETGMVIDINSKVLYEVAYADENCSGMVYLLENDMMIKLLEEDNDNNETNYLMYESSSRNEQYVKWDYTKCMSGVNE